MMGTGIYRFNLARFVVATCLLFSLTAGAQSEHPDFSGVWSMNQISYIKMDDGNLPPMRPEANALYTERVEALRAGKQIPDSPVACLPHGVPRIMYQPYPMLIIQQPDLVAFIFEVNHNVRLAYMDYELPENPDPTYMGYSSAHWDGDTLVVETMGLNDKIQIDRAGLPQGESTHVTERFRLVDGGARLVNQITITDDSLYTEPWSYTVDYHKESYKLMEYVCDNNRWTPQ